MEIIFVWQLVVAASIAISRAFSSTAMIVVAGLWTGWTFLAVWASGLMLLQLVTAWGTVWILSSLFGKRVDAAAKDVVVAPQPESYKNRDAIIKAFRAGTTQAETTAATNEPRARATTPPVKMSAVTSILGGVTTVANATTTALESFNKALDGINDGIQRQAAKMAANQEILAQLHQLRLSVETALKIAEQECEIQRKSAANPEFARIYTEMKERLEGANSEKKVERELELRGVTLAPQRPSELPPLAADERAKELAQCLKLLATTQTRLSSDPKLQQEISKIAREPFSRFLLRQRFILRKHLEFLSPQRPFEKDSAILEGMGADDLSAPTTIPLNALKRSLGFEEVFGPTSDKKEIGALNNSDQGGFRKSDPPIMQVGQWGRKDIESFARELAIPHLVHFTRCENLPGILKHGLMSIAACGKTGLASVRNDMDRLDGQPDGISLSIAFPNYRMFYKYRQLSKDADWAVLLISPRVLWERDCAFYRYNAADARVSREQRDRMKSLQAFRDMFAEDAGTREPSLRRFDPSDPQAEILVYETIPSSDIEAVAFETREVRTKHMDVLGGLESFYAGTGKGLFSARSRARST